MADERLLDSIKSHANDLKRRAEWLEKMLDRQNQAILNAQDTISHFKTDLQAVNLALDGLRTEYRRLVEQNGSKE